MSSAPTEKEESPRLSSSYISATSSAADILSTIIQNELATYSSSSPILLGSRFYSRFFAFDTSCSQATALAKSHHP